MKSSETNSPRLSLAPQTSWLGPAFMVSRSTVQVLSRLIHTYVMYVHLLDVLLGPGPGVAVVVGSCLLGRIIMPTLLDPQLQLVSGTSARPKEKVY